MKILKKGISTRFGVLLLTISVLSPLQGQDNRNYQDLVKLFGEWRSFERPPILDGAPDYTAETFEKRYAMLKGYQEQLNAIDKSEWTLEKQADWYVLLAEMNGFDFNHRILKPWVRDPAFYKSVWMYKSDVPAHEGPTHHMVTEFWTYTFPLIKSEEERLLADLLVISPLMKQAQKNLIGNAQELWVTGIRDIKQQLSNLDVIKNQIGERGSKKLLKEIENAKAATSDFVVWLESEAEKKSGPSGIGKENYTWYQKNVHLVPMTWEDEVRLLKRELSRAWSSLKLEEHRNRNIPQLKAASSPAEFDALAEKSVNEFMSFLDQQEIVTVKEYFEPALREHMMQFLPEDQRNFFTIGAHFNPTPLYSHFYHWFELARMEYEPNISPIRRGPLLYNIFDSRNEGTATAVEEMFMHAGLYDQNPRVREIVWIMVAQRAARGLGSLYAHANEMTMEDAGKIHSEWTPRGWMKTEKELLIFEQHLYLRQPGYGTSYIVGKYLLEEAMGEYARLKEQKGEPFKVQAFFDELNAIGNIPISLGRYQMTGLKDQLDSMLGE